VLCTLQKLTILDRYTKPEEYGIVTVPLPKMRDNDVLIKVSACGVCGMNNRSSLGGVLLNVYRHGFAHS
jgi:Zn-dependent alcohol dehydrogenase